MLNALVTPSAIFAAIWREWGPNAQWTLTANIPATSTCRLRPIARRRTTSPRHRHRRAADACPRLQSLGLAPRQAATFPRSRISSRRTSAISPANSVLLDFTCGRDNPAIPYIGAAIREECGLDEDTRTIADVPSRSLLSRLTDHYMQIIANRAPIGFEAEFANQREQNDLLSRHPDAFFVRRGDDRLHLRRHQLEAGRVAEPGGSPSAAPESADRVRSRGRGGRADAMPRSRSS